MAADAAAEVKARLDIADVIGSYVRLERSGRGWKALCPFHSERTPSFNVSTEKQTWYCFGCQEGGDVITFVEKHEHLEFLQALEVLAERAGVELRRQGESGRAASRRRQRALELNGQAQAFYEHVLWSTPLGAPGRDLLTARGVEEELARRFGIGFAPAGGGGGDSLTRWLASRGHGTADDAIAAGLAHPADRHGARDRFRHRLVFPIRDERGNTVGFGGRALGDAVPKYLNTPATDAYDKSRALFGIDLARAAIGTAGAALVVEGYFDVVAAHAAGVRHAVASSGTALTSAQVRLLARFTATVVLCFDGDDAGQAATTRAVDTVSAEGLEARIVALPAGVKDPDELFRRDPAALLEAVERALPAWEVLVDGAVGAAEAGSVEERRAAAERAVGVLGRIPEASARELYAQRAARRLGLEPSALLADVGARLAGRRGAGRIVVAMPPPAVTTAAVARSGPATEAAGVAPRRSRAIPGYESHLGSLAAQHPDALARLVDPRVLRLDDIASPVVRRLVEHALDASRSEPFATHLLEPDDRSTVAWLLMRDVPELEDDADPDALGRAVDDNCRRVREAAIRVELEGLQRALRTARDGGRTGDVDDLAVRVVELGRELHAVASGAAAENVATT